MPGNRDLDYRGCSPGGCDFEARRPVEVPHAVAGANAHGHAAADASNWSALGWRERELPASLGCPRVRGVALGGLEPRLLEAHD